MARKRSKEQAPETTVEAMEAATAEPTEGGPDAPASATTPPAGAGAEVATPAAVVQPVDLSGQTAEMSSADRERIAQAQPAEGDGGGAGEGAADRASEARDQAAEKAQQVRETVTEKAQQVRATVADKTQGAQAAPARADDAFDERPEVFVLGALAGGFVLAKLIGALGGDE